MEHHLDSLWGGLVITPLGKFKMTLTRSGGTGPGQSLSGKVYPIAPFLRLCLACRGKKLPDVHTDTGGVKVKTAAARAGQKRCGQWARIGSSPPGSWRWAQEVALAARETN